MLICNKHHLETGYYIQTAKQELPLAYKNNQYDALEFENNSFQYVRFEKTIDN
jgi:hypothetical protein